MDDAWREMYDKNVEMLATEVEEPKKYCKIKWKYVSHTVGDYVGYTSTYYAWFTQLITKLMLGFRDPHSLNTFPQF